MSSLLGLKVNPGRCPSRWKKLRHANVLTYRPFYRGFHYQAAERFWRKRSDVAKILSAFVGLIVALKVIDNVSFLTRCSDSRPDQSPWHLHAMVTTLVISLMQVTVSPTASKAVPLSSKENADTYVFDCLVTFKGKRVLVFVFIAQLSKYWRNITKLGNSWIIYLSDNHLTAERFPVLIWDSKAV